MSLTQLSFSEATPNEVGGDEKAQTAAATTGEGGARAQVNATAPAPAQRR